MMLKCSTRRSWFRQQLTERKRSWFFLVAAEGAEYHTRLTQEQRVVFRPLSHGQLVEMLVSYFTASPEQRRWKWTEESIRRRCNHRERHQLVLEAIAYKVQIS